MSQHIDISFNKIYYNLAGGLLIMHNFHDKSIYAQFDKHQDMFRFNVNFYSYRSGVLHLTFRIFACQDKVMILCTLEIRDVFFCKEKKSGLDLWLRVSTIHQILGTCGLFFSLQFDIFEITVDSVST